MPEVADRLRYLQRYHRTGPERRGGVPPLPIPLGFPLVQRFSDGSRESDCNRMELIDIWWPEALSQNQVQGQNRLSPAPPSVMACGQLGTMRPDISAILCHSPSLMSSSSATASRFGLSA